LKYIDKAPNIVALLDKLDTLRQELNAATNFNSQSVQSHVACYPGNGARYIRHLDASKHGSSRRLTCLFYLNSKWEPSHGGQLRIYNNGKDAIDISPIADRLLIFQSRMIEHEVLPSFQKRFAITTWFY